MDWRDETVHINRVQALRAAVSAETMGQRRFRAFRACLVRAQAYLILAAVGAIGGALGGYTLKSTTSVAMEVKQGFEKSVRERAEERAVARVEGQQRQRFMAEALGRR